MEDPKFIKATPHLPVINLRQTLDYYRDILGFYDEWTEGKTDGGIRRDDLRMLFGEDAEYTRIINSDKSHLNLLWFVNDIEGVYAEYQANGIVVASPLSAYSYGLREFAFIDVNGYYIRVAEQIK